MWKRLLLACVLAILYVLPVSADVSELQKIVADDSKCVNDDLGVYAGNIELRAIWNANTYHCLAGEYLDATNAECTACPGNGTYCPDENDYEYKDDENQGIQSCGLGWTSETGAHSKSECYKTGTTTCAEYMAYNVENGTAVYNINDSFACKQMFGSEQCVPQEGILCSVDHLICNEGFEQKTVDGSLQCVALSKECAAGTYLAVGASECSVCPEGSYCPGMTYTLNDYTELNGITSCPSGLSSPVGSRHEDDCGRILHVGEGEKDIIHMHKHKQDKRTEHSLAVKVDNVTYYADTTPVVDGVDPTPINPYTDKTMRVKIDGVEYYVHERIYE
jgi:hypothetical protein